MRAGDADVPFEQVLVILDEDRVEREIVAGLLGVEGLLLAPFLTGKGVRGSEEREQAVVPDPSALEADARVMALDNARERAGQIAENIEVELGDIVSVVEMNTGAYPMFDGGFGGAASVVEPGQLTVNMQVQVTFQMNR